jgi:hypothetical protein
VNFVLRVALREIAPPIWRTVRVPGWYTLNQLHRVFQMIFGWQDYHLYAFEIGSRRFERKHPESEGEDTGAATLAKLGLERGTEFSYEYDFGDGWVHEVRVEDVQPTGSDEDDWQALPVLLGGERAGPPEDCGGPFGYQDLVDALRNPADGDPEHDHLRAWVGGAYDPERFDVWMANQNLALAAVWAAI